MKIEEGTSLGVRMGNDEWVGCMHVLLEMRQQPEARGATAFSSSSPSGFFHSPKKGW